MWRQSSTRLRGRHDEPDEEGREGVRPLGYDALQDASEPEYIRGERSMSVGDIVEQEGEYYGCVSIGWQEIDLVKGSDGS